MKVPIEQHNHIKRLLEEQKEIIAKTQLELSDSNDDYNDLITYINKNEWDKVKTIVDNYNERNGSDKSDSINPEFIQNNLGYYVANSINGGGRVEQKDKYNIDFTTKEITDVIITALCNYYDYNELHPSEGRMVVTAIRDIQRYVRDIKYDNILDDLMDILSEMAERGALQESTLLYVKDSIYDYFNKLKNK